MDCVGLVAPGLENVGAHADGEPEDGDLLLAGASPEGGGRLGVAASEDLSVSDFAGGT